MKGSIQIGTAFGIPVRLHWSWLLVLFFFASVGLAPQLLVLFGSVLLHELGHSLTARRYGIRVIDITFWPLGGMARMSEMPEVPRVEGVVAIAGPLVNFVLVALGVLLTGLAGLSGSAWLVSFFTWFAGTNLLLGTFNLVPAFPMDGGRILRAWLARKMDWVSATETAVAVGRFVATAMFVLSLAIMFFVPQAFCALPLIAIFIWIAGGRELLAVRLRHGVSPFGGSPMGNSGRPAAAEAAPVESSSQPASAEDESARRPETWEQDQPRGGFSAEAIETLERFRGRLRRYPREE